MEQNKMPVGFAMALAMNPEAMQAFAMLNEEQKRDIIDGTHSIDSKEEMHRYVNDIVKNKR